MAFIGAICPQLSTDNDKNESVFLGSWRGMKIAFTRIGKEEG